VDAPPRIEGPRAPRPAGIGRRLAAIAYDLLLLLGVLFAATAVFLPLAGGEARPPRDPAYDAYLLLVSFGYFGGFWVLGGQTLGMRAWGIRVVDEATGGRVGWKQAVVRFLGALLSWTVFGAGFLWCLVDRRDRGWHDLLSGTALVVDEPS
jgi:uncharacterized RDD family membrane protein YckC